MEMARALSDGEMDLLVAGVEDVSISFKEEDLSFMAGTFSPGVGMLPTTTPPTSTRERKDISDDGASGDKADEGSTDDERLTILDILPWEDVLVARILPHLDITDLFRLRLVSRGFRDVVAIHFAESHHIDLSHVGPSFTADAFQVMALDARNLLTLSVPCCKKWITDDLILPVIENNPHLRKINISENSSLSTEVVRTIGVNCHDLRCLMLAECQQITSTSVEGIAMNCEQLEQLDLTGCWNMDDDTMNTVLQLNRNLTWLSVARLYGITGNLVNLICCFCPNIEYLDIQGCWRITDEVLCKLWDMAKLKTLKVKDCRYITERSLARFRTRGVQLDIVLHGETDLAKLERHLRAREFARTRNIPPNFVF
ncbi:uncharacterized protein [Diadema setosum]|uniref:uncharacterized protein n=1 Tax=Diadema setosum TaxID=31175 RepID=UPI003B3B8C56